MNLRQARKIADRIHDMKASRCPYTEWQMFRAYSRLHTEWRKRRIVTVDDEGRTSHRVTEDYFRTQWVWTMILRRRHFRHGKYVSKPKPECATLHSWVRRTWSPPQS